MVEAYSDGQSANFADHSLDKYRIVFNQTLHHSPICRYVTHLEKKPSKAIAIEAFRKTLFTQNVKTANTEDRCNAKLASFVIAGIPFASSAFNGEHNKQKRHPRKITDFVL
ncbi:hypothetical protein T4D_3306 [Trichinella pseudospiralis]|uniref:Uncharacterized protein n=1 Tax=Trichinella pseudospiralis TaxID=6337 RepID=A0A0V1F3Z0_TRIPS|nr:hypothetical protein T4D_16466 [Trichinella pseudospiralis]KRY80815.1 hypothetical protein T4D_3306 [Trichinella pseudospiralis]